MTTIKEFEKTMYSLNIDEVDKKIAEAKTSKEANFLGGYFGSGYTTQSKKSH